MVLLALFAGTASAANCAGSGQGGSGDSCSGSNVDCGSTTCAANTYCLTAANNAGSSDICLATYLQACSPTDGSSIISTACICGTAKCPANSKCTTNTCTMTCGDNSGDGSAASQCTTADGVLCGATSCSDSEYCITAANNAGSSDICLAAPVTACADQASLAVNTLACTCTTPGTKCAAYSYCGTQCVEACGDNSAAPGDGAGADSACTTANGLQCGTQTCSDGDYCLLGSLNAGPSDYCLSTAVTTCTVADGSANNALACVCGNNICAPQSKCTSATHTCVIDGSYYLGGGATTLDMTDVTFYPNTDNYYKDRVANSTAQNINRGLHPDYYLGHISCPGRSVCKEAWVGNGYCDDCFGCDQYMIATGFYGDCSTCDYFWSGGEVAQGEFDGGDCGDFVFPNAVNEAFLDQCLNDTGIRTYTELGTMGYAQKRNTVILELNAGGWGAIPDLQANTDVTLAAKCEYANIKQCLIKNGWYTSNMGSDTNGDLRFTATTYIDDLTTYSSYQLVQMTDVDLLEQCVLAGVTQAMLHHGWSSNAESTTMTSDSKRNRAISSLQNLGFGTTAQLQTLHNSQLRFLMDHLATSGLAPDEHAW